MPSASKHKVFCFLNPLSCGGYSQKKWPTIERIFKELSINCELVSFKGDISKETLRVLGRCDDPRNTTFAGVGGDGTHCAIINGMMEYKKLNESAELPFYSIIPLGTGNNIAKSFLLSRNEGFFSSELRRTIAGTVYGAVFKVDLGKVNGKYFLDAFTTGIDAHILTGRNRDSLSLLKYPILNKILMGYPLYFLNTVKSFGKCRHLDCKVEADGKIFHDGGLFNVIVNNTRIYAGELDPTDNAMANDGFLDLAIYTGRRDYLKSYLLGYRGISRKLRDCFLIKKKMSHHIKIEKAEIKFEKKVVAQIDGEEMEASDAYEISVIPEAISMKIPVEPA